MNKPIKKMLLVMPKSVLRDVNQMEWVEHHLKNPGGILAANLATVAALTSPEIEITIIDEMVEDIDFDEPYDLVGITGFHNHIPRAQAIAEEFSRRGILVVCGGSSVSLSPDCWRPFADVLIIGEAEDIWPEFVKDYLNGKHKTEYRELHKPDLAKSPIPDYSGFSKKALQQYTVGIVQTSRGCPFDCEFCDTIVYVGRRMRHKPIDKIIAEIEQLRDLGFRFIFLADDNFTAGRKRAKEVLVALRDWNRRQKGPVLFITQLSIDTADDEEMLELAVEAGLTLIFVGLESPSEESLTEVHKMQNVRRSMIDGIRKMQSHGILVWGAVIVGFDHDNISIFRKQFEFLQQAGIPNFTINVLYAADGTPLKHRIEEEGRYLTSYHTLPGHSSGEWRPSVIPKSMTVKQLEQGTIWLMWELSKPEHVAERFRVFLDVYKKSEKRRRVTIPRYRATVNGRTLLLVWRIIVFLRTKITHHERWHMRRMLWMAFRSSHPHALPMAVWCFLRSKNFRAELLETVPDVDNLKYPERISAEVQQSFETEDRRLDCRWDSNNRLDWIERRAVAESGERDLEPTVHTFSQ